MKHHALALTLCGLLATSLDLAACSPATPSPYKMVAGEQGEFLYAMGFPQSGVYRNDGSLDPLWTLDDYYFEGQFELSQDGKHMVTLPDASIDTPGVAFYSNGELIRQYKVSTLVSDASSVDDNMCFMTWRKERDFDARNNLLRIVTTADDEYVFDITTGKSLFTARAGRKPIRAKVSMADDAELDLINLRVCWSGLYFLANRIGDLPENTTRRRFVDLRFVKSIESQQADPNHITLTMPDDQKLQIEPLTPIAFCATTRDQKTVMLTIADFRAIHIETQEPNSAKQYPIQFRLDLDLKSG